MKKRTLFGLLLVLALLAGCAAAPAPEVSDAPDAPEEAGALSRCRIVDGAEAGSLLLAETEGTGVYRLGTEALEITLDGAPAQASDLRDGMLVEVSFDGTVQERFPMGFNGATGLAAYSEGERDLCGLYLQVMADLWDADSGLGDGVTELGVDLSGLTDLGTTEKAALSWRFGELRGILPVNGTWEELAEWGYIDGENLIWEDGILFTLEGDAGQFTAEKWRSGLGAYFFEDCAARARDGVWSYTVGSEAIA